MKHRSFGEPLSRRALLQRTTLVTGGACLCRSVPTEGKVYSDACCGAPPVDPASIRRVENYLEVDLDQVKPLHTVGGAVNLDSADPELHLILVRTGRRTFHAVNRFCTHGGQVISYLPKRGVLMCNNFNHSVFGVDGRVIKGPADSPLACYPVHVHAGNLRIAIHPQ